LNPTSTTSSYLQPLSAFILVVVFARVTCAQGVSQKVLKPVPENLRPQLVERLSLYVEYQRAKQYDKFYDLLSKSTIHTVLRDQTREEFVRAYQSGDAKRTSIRLIEFAPNAIQLIQEDGDNVYVIVGEGNWQQLLEANKQAFTAEFIQRPRFMNAFPSAMSSAQFVDVLNANAGNPLSQSERDQLVSDLSTNAKTRAQVLRAVAENQNLINAECNRAFVLMQFFGYLRRNPNDPQDSDYTGYDFWLTKLNQFGGNFQNAEMVKAFITSTEYRQRFGPP
jgi:hypothetical protein